MKSIRGKRALVTGAASGIGREIALRLALEGADVWLLDVDLAGLQEVAHDARVCGVEAVAARCDLSESTEISAAIADMLAAWGSIDILVNNAGVAFYGATERMTAQQWDWLLAINLHAPIQITRELLPILMSQTEAHVLNVCSVAGLVAGPRSAAYHVSKFGLVGFTESLRAEYGRRGIGVTALCPGPVRTNLYKSAVSGSKRKAVPVPPAWLCTTPARIADEAVHAIRKNRRLVVITPIAHVLFNAKRFAPWFLDLLNHVTLRKRRPAAGATETPGLRPFVPAEAETEAEPALRRAA
ncbi:MAG TPA: SDR family oxidoreductase [Planctomycetaceae bacterium]|jgi:short-subunit dehydrogenase|nr:SDR family oxidoreductase [Planctomycetaceae bacterium]